MTEITEDCVVFRKRISLNEMTKARKSTFFILKKNNLKYFNFAVKMGIMIMEILPKIQNSDFFGWK